jgi:hypothetical protein
MCVSYFWRVETLVLSAFFRSVRLVFSKLGYYFSFKGTRPNP